MSKFLLDAQLPRRLAKVMQARGIDAVHTLDLPNVNKTKDREINQRSFDEQRVVVTKDADFVQSFTLQGRPYKLLLVSTGNISNQHLLQLFEAHLEQLTRLFEEQSFIELSQSFLIVHS